MLGPTAEIGYSELSVQDVLDRAGVSRPTFYEQFENKEDCFLAAFDAAAARLRERIEAAVADAGAELARPAPHRPRASCCASSPRNRDAALTVIVEARAACPAGLRRRDELLDHFASCIDALVREDLDERPLGDRRRRGRRRHRIGALLAPAKEARPRSSRRSSPR